MYGPNYELSVDEIWFLLTLFLGNNSRYLKVYAEDFFGGMKDARRSISKVINNY